jgi:signal transduction histidine kinase
MGTSGPEELGKLGTAFDDMAARLEQADRDQRQFLADVAHEIATPVNAVSGFALALADSAAQVEHEREEAKSVIELQVGRLRDLLRDLWELTQLDLSEGVRRSPVSLRPFAERLVASFRPVARDAGVDLRLEADDGEVVTDARLLEMIASNLLANAIRYTPSGGSVQFELPRHWNELVLRVCDTGVGIALENQRRIFDPSTASTAPATVPPAAPASAWRSSTAPSKPSAVGSNSTALSAKAVNSDRRPRR